jgi:hypothetical protein
VGSQRRTVIPENQQYHYTYYDGRYNPNDHRYVSTTTVGIVIMAVSVFTAIDEVEKMVKKGVKNTKTANL